MRIIFDNDPEQYANETITLNMEEFKNLMTFILWQGTDFEINEKTMPMIREKASWQIWNLINRDKKVLSMPQEYLPEGTINFIQ